MKSSQSNKNYKELSDLEFYHELTIRNVHFFSRKLQEKLSKVKVLLAGCGTIGGACTEPFARAGVKNFLIAEPDRYELNNLNRQPSSVSELGLNKGEVQKEKILSVNPFSKVTLDVEGINIRTADRLVSEADFIFDGVDITTSSGIAAKILLHETAWRMKKPVVSGLDLGFCQMGYAWPYHEGSIEPLHGRVKKAKRYQNPMKVFFSLFPIDSMPLHAMEMLHDGIIGKSVSQLGLAGNLMSATGLVSLVRYLDTGDLVPWNVNLARDAMGSKLIREYFRGFHFKRKIKNALKVVD